MGAAGLAVALPLGCAGPAGELGDEPAAARVWFEDVTAEAGLGGFRHESGAQGRKWFPETMGAGGAFLDYDGDGRLDILLASGGRLEPENGSLHEAAPVPAVRLYRNAGDGGFVDTTEAAGLGGFEGYSFGVWPADVDGDGDADVFVTTLGRDLLFLNDGGRFREAGREAGLAGDERWTTAAAFFDADGDGALDLFVGGYVDWSPERDVFCSLDAGRKSYCTPEVYRGAGGRFYRGAGDGTFAEETEVRGFGGDRGKTLGAVTLDYDGDGWTDLFVANDTAADRLYHNEGGTFTEVGVAAGVAFDEAGRPRGGMGADAGVLENVAATGADGTADELGATSLVVANFAKEMIGVYRYAGDGTFADRAASSRIGRASLLTLAFGLCLADFDLDGDLDLFTANGHVQDDVDKVPDGVRYRQRPHLLLNDGSGVFTEARRAPGDGLEAPLVARGAAYGDFDADGDVDLLVTENGGPAHLWRNRAVEDGAAFLRVRLRGPGPNRDAVGYRVVVEAGGRRMEREVRGAGSYLSASERTLTFGLGSGEAGAAERVNRLQVFGPQGPVTELLDLEPRQAITLDLAKKRP